MLLGGGGDSVQQARKNRPKKHRLSDINRTPPKYDVEPMIAARKSIPEYTKIGEVCVWRERVSGAGCRLRRIAMERTSAWEPGVLVGLGLPGRQIVYDVVGVGCG